MLEVGMKYTLSPRCERLAAQSIQLHTPQLQYLTLVQKPPITANDMKGRK